MLEAPHVVETTRQLTAVIRLKVPRAEIQRVMGPAIGEVMAAVSSQGVGPIGAMFTHHFRMSPDEFDFEVGVPVRAPVAAVGRVVPSELPATTVARAIYRGPYEGLGAAWAELMKWIAAEGLTEGAELWECYLEGPETGRPPSEWRTEFNRPIARGR